MTSKDERETFTFESPANGKDEITVVIQDNRFVSFSVFAEYGGPVDLDSNFSQKADVGLSHEEALRMAKWIIQKLEDN